MVEVKQRITIWICHSDANRYNGVAKATFDHLIGQLKKVNCDKKYYHHDFVATLLMKFSVGHFGDYHDFFAMCGQHFQAFTAILAIYIWQP